MAGGKETPRQKMIGIMYLVLMAMLALNVSDTILNAFSTINNSLATSTGNVNAALQQSVRAFEQTKLKDNPARAQPIYNDIKKIQQLTGELENYIVQLKSNLIKEAGGIEPETGEIKQRDNLDISPRVMWSEGNEKKGKGYELQRKINATRDQLLALLDPKDRANVAFSLEAKNPTKKSTSGTKLDWVETNFGEGIPVTASVTILSKIQADVKNAESAMVKKFLAKMDEALVNFDAFQAVAVAPSSYVIQGQPYTAEVYLTAYDSKKNPDIKVNGSNLAIKDGKGVYTVNTNSEGEFKWKGTVRVQQTDGTFKVYETPEQTYKVARPSAVVSPDKMNVFYRGVANPVSVSAPGIAKDKLKVSISGGSISGSNGQYVVKVSGGSEATVTVSADIVPGKTTILGSSKFRIKTVPDPVATFASKQSGQISASTARSTNLLQAELKDFDFDLKFRVVKFQMFITRPRQDPLFYQSSEGSFSGAIKQNISSLNPGDIIIFQNIVVSGEDGTTRTLDGGINISIGR